MLSTLGFLIEFNKHIIALNLIIFGKDNIICFSLDNAIMCLNSIGEPNVPKLSNCTYVLP
jgi:hypothetical protein